ncbi:MAG: glycosyl transferase family 51 [Sphingobacteriaceae bacterium]|nr:glycosyl transferase family 51 [Sphingobacteriaceae bacterium]
MTKYPSRSMRIPPRYLKVAGIVFGSLIILVLIGGIIAYSKRETILRATIDKAVRKAKKDYNLDVHIKSAKFEGLRTVVFRDVSVVPDNRDSLAFIRNLRVGVKLLPLLFGDVKLAEVGLHDGRITLVKRDSLRNYEFLFRKRAQDTVSTKKVNLADVANKLLNNVFNKVPDDMDVREFTISYNDNGDKVSLSVPSATIDGGKLKSTILVNKSESRWHVEGDVDPGDKQFDVRLFAEGKKLELPFLQRKYDLKLNFDTLHAQMKSAERTGDELRISGTWAIKNLLLNHPKVAANDIIVPNGAIDADLIVGEDFVSVDSSSVIRLKNITANPYIKYTLGKKKKLALKLHTDYLDAQSLFDAFPQGLFESLEGMQVAGKLQYDLDFFIDTARPDSVRLSSSLNKKDFKIVKWGKTDLQKINSTFVYTPYEYGKPMRDIVVGPSNPNFTPLDEISSNLKNALLTAEDPSFFSHHGFVEESIRKSIATNFKEKAFKRGGSTISMQLVKNVYLNRQKTLARKIEEMLIVWLIENNRLSSKQRMFETYLNLIEWGRNVYGIGEASRYYFGKRPSEITLGEGIFLASIVPRPKKGLYFFEPDGSLRQGLHGYFRLIGNLMAKKGLTQRDSDAYGFYGVRLKESLRQEVVPDSVVTDSTLLMDDDDTQSFLRDVLGPKEKKATDSIRVSDPNKSKVPPRDTLKVPETPKSRREQRKAEREARKKDGS